MFKTKEEHIVRENMVRHGMLHVRELSAETGIPSRMLCERMARPEMLRLFELRNIIRALKMSDEDILQFVTGEWRREKTD